MPPDTTPDPTPEERAEAFVSQAFTDAIAWTAARILLEQALPLVEQAEAGMIVAGRYCHPIGTADAVSERIIRFLAAHPA